MILTILLGVTKIISAQDEALYYDRMDKKIYISIQAKIAGANVKPVTVELHESEKLVENTDKLIESKDITPTDKGGKKIELVFDLTKELDVIKKYEVKILSSGILWKSLEVKSGLKVTFLKRGDPVCSEGIPMVFSGIKADLNPTITNSDGLDKDAADFWEPILKYLDDNYLDQKTIVETSWGKAEILDLQSAQIKRDTLKNVTRKGNITICLIPKTKPSSENFNIRVKFENPPFHLSQEFTGEDLTWSNTTAIKSSDALPDSPDKRQIDKNLDLGLSFTSNVKTDKTTKIRKRESVGILDIRLAPWFNIINYKPGDEVLKQWTPIYLNANVATGKITDSTLSLNRIIIGTEWEYRFVPSLSLDGEKFVNYKSKMKKQKCDTIGDKDEKSKCEEKIDNQGNFIDYYRLKLNGNHSSDRDFKQKEITAGASFEPVWAFLNKPRDARWFNVKDDIFNKKQITGYKTFGWEIVPKIGFEFGKTYSRHNPVSAIKESDFIKRLYGGIDMKFDITSNFKLKLEDTLYGRYELKSNRLKNYFKGEIYAPIGNPFNQTTNGLFLSFEKGDAPPFTNTVNVVKFGYRIQSNRWNGLLTTQ